MDTVVVSLSGGCDSSTLLFKVANDPQIDKIHVVSLDYSQRHKKELESAKEIVEYLKRTSLGYKIQSHKFLSIDLRQFGNSSVLVSDNQVPDETEDSQASTVVPYRNTLFTILIASQAKAVGAHRVFLGPVKLDYDIYHDCRPQFFVSLQHTLRASNDIPNLVIETPFISWDKKDISQLGVSLGVPYELTWTCYKGEERPCLKCNSCMERIEGFHLANLKDPALTDEEWEQATINYLNSLLAKVHESLV